MASSDRNLSSVQEVSRRRPRSFTEVVVHGGLRRPSRPLGHTEAPVLQPASATSVDNMYQQLHLALAAGPLALKIPETLLVSEEGQDVLLVNDSHGTIQQSPSSDPLAQFLALCSAQSSSLSASGFSEYPLFIFYTAASPYKVLFSPSEAEKVWNSSRDHTKLLQRYIPPHCRDPCKTRLIWYRTGVIKRFHIKKRGIESLLQNFRLSRPRNTGSPKASYVYASRLKRESFSPYLPYKSVLEDRGAETPQPTVEPLSPRTEESFLVSAKAEGEYDWEAIPTQLVQAERFLTVVKDVVSRFVLREDEQLQEVAFDVMQDLEDQYYFLNVKWLRCSASDDGCAVSSGRKAACDLRSKFSSLMAAKVPDDIPFIDMHEIQAQNVKMYMSQFSSLASSHPHPVSPPSNPPPKVELDHANTQLDSLAQSASTLKQRDEEIHRVRLESYQNEKLLDAVISKVYAKVTADQTLQHYFANMSKRELNMLKLGFSKAFSGVDNYYFKRTVKKAHEGLGIDKKQFDKFVVLFQQAMLEEGVRSSDIETVSRHLNRFSDEVIEDDM